MPYQSNPNSQVRTKHPAVPCWSCRAHPTPITFGDTASPWVHHSPREGQVPHPQGWPGCSRIWHWEQRWVRPLDVDWVDRRFSTCLLLHPAVLCTKPPSSGASKGIKSQTFHFSTITSSSFPTPFFSFLEHFRASPSIKQTLAGSVAEQCPVQHTFPCPDVHGSCPDVAGQRCRGSRHLTSWSPCSPLTPGHRRVCCAKLLDGLAPIPGGVSVQIKLTLSTNWPSN